MVGLSASPEEYTDKGFTPERLSASLRSLSERYHMPMDTSIRPRMSATLPACQAVVATRLNRPELERPLLRRLRIRHFAGDLLDEQSTIEAAGEDVGIGPAELSEWMSDPATKEALEEDLHLARHPTPEAVALEHKLAAWSEGWRYTCPSYELLRPSDGARVSVPGFQPLESYEVGIANLLPTAERRGDPTGVAEVLAWAGEPLATAEVATLCKIELEQAREELGRVAEETHLGFDGLWELPAHTAPTP